MPTAAKVTNPYEVIVDASGEELNEGYIYIGTAGTDPQTNQISVYSDTALTTPLSQPIRTSNGLLVVAGTPVNAYVATDYSIKILNRQLAVVRSKLSGNAPQGAGVQYSSVSALRGESGGRFSHGDKIWIAGEAEPFEWDATSTASENGAGSGATKASGTVVKLTNTTTGRFLRDFEGIANVRWFGGLADTSHTPTTSGADIQDGSHSLPSGTDNMAAFKAAFAASKVVRVPKSTDGGWYKLGAGIGTAAGHDGLHVPDGGVLILEGDILIDSRYDEMGWTGATPNVPASGSSFGFTYQGDFSITGGGRIDGGSQYTGVQGTSKEEFTYMRTFGPETISAISSLRCHDIRMLNSCGTHITGGPGSTNHSFAIGLCHFGDYRDHAIYFTGVGDSSIDGNAFKALKTTTTRDAVKGAGANDGFAVTNNMFDIPNGIACDLGGNAAGAKAYGYRFEGNGVNALVGLRFSAAADTSGIDDLAIVDNTFRTSSYCVIGGSATQATNVNYLFIRGNVFIPTSTGIPVYLQSGSTGAGSGGATSSDSAYLDFEISNLIMDGNTWLGSTTQAQCWLYGTFPYAEFSNNKWLGTGASFPVRIGGFDQMEPDASYAVFKNNTARLQSAQALVEFAGTAVWASTDDVPWSLDFEPNKFIGSTTRYLLQVGAAPSALVSGSIKYGHQLDVMTGVSSGSSLSAATITDLTETYGTADSGGSGYKLLRVAN